MVKNMKEIEWLLIALALNESAKRKAPEPVRRDSFSRSAA
jgi:hypothetical protein